MTGAGDNSSAEEPAANREFEHASVMLDEVVSVLADVPPGVIVDATLGGGGHAEALLAARDEISILGLDQIGRAHV